MSLKTKPGTPYTPKLKAQNAAPPPFIPKGKLKVIDLKAVIGLMSAVPPEIIVHPSIARRWRKAGRIKLTRNFIMSLAKRQK